MEQAPQRFESRQSMCRNDFEIFHYREPKPGCVELHHHDFYEIYCFLGGNVEYRVEGKSYFLQTGDFLLINPMELHQPIVMPESQVYERIVLWINRDYLTGLEQGNLPLTQCFGSGRNNLLHPTGAQAEQIRTCLDALVREHRGGGFGSEYYARGLFLQLMVELNRLSLPAVNEAEDTQPLSARVVAYISRHYRESLTLESIAQEFYISKYHLSHQFTQATGVSVYRYLVMKRLQSARRHLLDGESPKTAFSASGFGDYANFYRAFLSEYGVTPHTFAQQRQIETE